MCTGTTPACVKTCGRGVGTHGDVLNLHTEVFSADTRGGRGREGHRQFCLPKFAHRGSSRAPEVHQRNAWEFTHLKFENRSNTARSRFLQSFALPESCSVSAVLRDTAEGTTNTTPTHSHHHHHHSLPPLPPTHTTHLHDHKHKDTHKDTHKDNRIRTHKRTRICICICTCTCQCICLCSCICL